MSQNKVNTQQISALLTSLHAHPFLRDLMPSDREWLAAQASTVHFTPGQFLLREGATANTFFLIQRGEVVIESAPAAGLPLSVARIHAGGVVGYSWLFPPYRNGFDALAITEVSALAISAEPVRTRAAQDPEFGYRLMQRFANVMLERLQATRRQMLDVYAHLQPDSRPADV